MPLYWAQFVKHGEDLFRLDTRIYLAEVAECRPGDQLVGAVVAKNPGSARPRDVNSTGLHPITLKNDKLIPTVRSFVRKAYQAAGVEFPVRGYVQVLNLFYLCDKDYKAAIRKIARIADAPIDPSEQEEFPWIMYLWGDSHRSKAPHIIRFRDIASDHHFYLDQNLQMIVEGVPGNDSFARHTQGMDLDLVIAHLATLIGAV
jgi:hypothetical protein